MLNPNRYPTVYDELISFYPDYYRGIKEMQAILHAQGTILDGLVEAIDIIIDNNFITTAHEEMIERLEAFLEIVPLTNNLEDRRQNILSYFIGFGHISATKLKALIRAFTQEDSEITFSTKDENQNYILSITITKKQGVNPDWDILYNLLDNRIPAHIQTCRVIVYPAPSFNYVFGATILAQESYGFTVPEYDFSDREFLETHGGALLRTHSGKFLYRERTGG